MQKESIPKTRELRHMVTRDQTVLFALHDNQAKSIKCEHFWINEETLEYNILVSFDEVEYGLSPSIEDTLFTQTWWRVVGVYDRVPHHQEVLAVAIGPDNIAYILVGDKKI